MSEYLIHYGVKGMKWGHHKYKTDIASDYRSSRNFNKNDARENTRFMVTRAAATARIAGSGKDPREPRRKEFRYQLSRNTKRARARSAAARARRKYANTRVADIRLNKSGSGYNILAGTGLWRTHKDWTNPERGKRLNKNQNKKTGVKHF